MDTIKEHTVIVSPLSLVLFDDLETMRETHASASGVSHESRLLLTLEEISQLVSHSHDPGETLVNIVRLIQGRFHTDVCSVYLLEPERAELVLGATVGLKADSVGRVRMRLDEGLTGLVAERMAPVTVVDAFAHARFKYFPEAGEDPYHSFLGVPLVEGGELQGVLVVQTLEPRAFSPSEIRMLITAASQVVPLVSDAHLLERVLAAAHETGDGSLTPARLAGPTSLAGAALSPGIGLGQAYVVDDFESWRAAPESAADLAIEKSRLAQAMAEAREEIGRLSQRISVLVGEDHGAILQAQLMILQDRQIERDLTACLAAGSSAERALLQTLDQYVAAFQKLPSPFFQERVYDVKDVFRRILWHLRPVGGAQGSAEGKLVLVAREASVMDLFSVDLDDLAAVVVEHGGAQSHAAILARSLGVPMVSQATDFARLREPGRRLLVDGSAGVVHVEPTPELLRVLPAAGRRTVATQSDMDLDASTPERPRVEVNINLIYEVGEAIEHHAAGVGLFRSEFLFLARRTLPSEDEQVDIYRKLLTQLRGRPATIRTFDLRPDKLAHGDHLASSAGHTLDWRLVLSSPPMQNLFREQVRAILRAAVAGPARILVPFIMRTEQLDLARETLHQAREELRREGLEFNDEVPLGVMLEASGAAMMVEDWIEELDFVALGTNDLLASTLGIERDHPVGAGPADLLHPGLLRLIRQVVQIAHRAQRPVTVCGEMAADADGMIALAALDVDSLSVPVHQLSTTRRTLATLSRTKLIWLGERITQARSGEAVRKLIRE